MVELSTALQDHRWAVNAFLETARAVPAAQWSQPRAPGKWSAGQVAEHVTLAYEANRGVLDGTAPGPAAPRLLRPLIRKFFLNPVLRRGRFIPGSKSPRAFRPSPVPVAPAALLDRLQAAVAGFETSAGVAHDASIDHPFFGRLALVDFVRLQELHTRHHRAQLATTGA